MKKILLLNLPGKKPYIRDCYCSHVAKAAYIWHPLDLVILSGILSKDFELSVIDAMVANKSVNELIKTIKKENLYAIFCLIGNISFKEDIIFLKRIRKIQPQVHIFILGDTPLHKGKSILKEYPFIDGSLLDFTSKNVLKFLNKKEEFKIGKPIDNLIYKKNRQLIDGRRKLKRRFFEYPVPRHELFPLKSYRLPMQKHTPFISILTSDGCPFDCKFCPSSNSILGFKLRKIENVLEELDYIRSLGIRELRFRDNTFIANKNYSIKLLETIIEKKYNFSYSCLTRVDTVDEKILLLMKKSGCHTIQFGVESGSNQILKKFNKRINTKQIKKIFALCQKLKINTLAHFILGLPGETIQSLQKTLSLAKEIKPNYVSFNIAQALPGTRLRNDCLKNEWCHNNKTTINAPLLSYKQIVRFQKQAYQEFYLRPKFIFKKIIKTSSLRELFSDFTNMLNLFRSI